MEELKKSEAVEILKKKIAILERKREYIKTKYYYDSEILDINAGIREIKRKIKLLEKSEDTTSITNE